MTDLELDLATVIARIEQIGEEPHGSLLRDDLVERLVSCDAPRLRGHLGPEALATLAEATRP